MTVMDLSDFFILNIKNNDYRDYISNIDKKEAIIVFKKSNLDDKESYKWILRLCLLNEILLL